MPFARLVVAAVLALSAAACAAGPCPASSKSDSATALRGPIGAPLVAQARQALALGQHRFTIQSLGGSVEDAVALGHALRAAGARLEVDGVCWSACVHALLLVDDRHAGPGVDVRLHRAAAAGGGDLAPWRLDDGAIIQISTAAFGAALYRQLGVPADLVTRDTAGLNMRRLAPADLARMGLQT